VNPGPLIRRKGSPVTVRRKAESRAAGDNSAVLSWSTVADDVKVFLQPASARLLQQAFGRELEAEFVGFAESTTPVQTGDGLIVTAGYRAGDRLTVVQMVDPDQGPRHKVLALTTAREPTAFT